MRQLVQDIKTKLTDSVELSAPNDVFIWRSILDQPFDSSNGVRTLVDDIDEQEFNEVNFIFLASKKEFIVKIDEFEFQTRQFSYLNSETKLTIIIKNLTGNEDNAVTYLEGKFK